MLIECITIITLMSKSGSILFRPLKIKNLTIMNRFLRSALWDANADAEGNPTDEALEHLVYLAQGEVGLIATPALSADPKAVGKGTFGMVSENNVEGWAQCIESIKTRGNKVMFQINHKGTPQSNQEVEEVIEQFTKSCLLAEKAGADIVQLHCAHGFLLSRFLSPATNQRTDKWGGSVANRCRIIKEIIAEVRKKSNVMFSMKMNGNDFVEGGITPQTAPDYVNELVNCVDLFEISCGMGNPMHAIPCEFNKAALIKGVKDSATQKSIIEAAKKAITGVHFQQEYNRMAAEEIKKRVPKAVLALVGANREFSKMEKLVKDGVCDIVSMARPLLKNPFLVKEFYDGTRDKADCINCGACILNLTDGIYCHLNKERIW